MQKKAFTNEESLHNVQRRAYAVLHVNTILFILFLIIYMIVGLVVINSLFNTPAYSLQYSLQACIELLLWMISIVLLWKGSHAGRVMFTVIGIVSLYAIYNFVGFFQYSMTDGVDKLVRSIYLIFFVCKSLTVFLMMVKLFQSPITYIWSENKQQAKSEEEQDQQRIQQLLQSNEQQQQKIKARKRMIHRALHNIRRNAIILFIILYGSIILFYMLMFLVRYLFSSDATGIDFVQRHILLASLFTALVWSISAILLFLYKRQSILGIYGAWMLEALRFLLTIANTISTFQTQHYGLPSILAIIIMEVVRYTILMRFTMFQIRDPFITAYWKEQRMRKKRIPTKT